MSKNQNSTSVVTGICTFSYLHCWEPRAELSGKPMYSVCLIIPKSDQATVARIRSAIEAAYARGRAKLAGSGSSVPALASLRLPLRDGDREHPGDPLYQGCWFLNARSSRAPQVVDAGCHDILDHSAMYSGVRGRASIDFYAYCIGGNRGIGCSLEHLQKLADGDRLGGRARAQEVFADRVEDDFLS